MKLVVSDIFGRTPELESLVGALKGPVTIFDPYDSMFMGFTSQNQAYEHFNQHVGLNNYAQQLLAFIKSFSVPLTIIGFSVGASAIWKISDNSGLKHVSHAQCFYGSQIRYDVDIIPAFAIELIFPVFEHHFEINMLIEALVTKPNVKIQQVNYLHGFMNALSANFDKEAYAQYIEKIA
ncbi:hypothetical protein DBZ36_07765 [Alginatibacterium sediminis]|uniref:Dienelactone hydrolase domain-containing protein n=1 Tax=Alginatibacterium sediminis TaxID=2164068 RepID=A0A420EI47_9ALTE|nr:hypothetical protein [Alginatibacterium sediminis]RKF20327.1 hypothetical protein DBZ36_07765 [Alginatibacterium sediminis]